MNTTLLSVLVIGAGMYVGGRGANTDGTILPTLIQAQSQGLVGDISVAATSKASIGMLQDKLSQLNSRMGTSVVINGYPSQDPSDDFAYRKALKDLSHPACSIISVPDHLHASITSDVIEAGVHPLVVKPLTPTLREAVLLNDMAKAHKVHAAVEFHKRWDETNLLLRQAIKDNKLGDIRYITVEYSQKRLMQHIFKSWLDETNIFQYLGVHYVDLIYFLTKANPVRVLGVGQSSDPLNLGGTGGDSVQVLIEWELPTNGSRFVSTIVASWIDPDTTSAMSDQKITVVGNLGRYEIDQKNRGAQLVTQSNGIEEVNPYFSQIYTGNDGGSGIHGYGPRSINQFLKDVVDVASGISQKELLLDNRPSFSDCLISTAVTEAVNISLSNGGEWVYIRDLEMADRLAT